MLKDILIQMSESRIRKGLFGVLTDGYEVINTSNPDTKKIANPYNDQVYYVKGRTCTCPDYKKGFVCKHILMVEVNKIFQEKEEKRLEQANREEMTQCFGLSDWA